MDEEAVEPTTPADPLAVIQSAIADSSGDDGSLLAGFIVVAEWIEADGTTAMSVVHSPMPPWHVYGLLTFGREWCQGGTLVQTVCDEDDDDF